MNFGKIDFSDMIAKTVEILELKPIQEGDLYRLYRDMDQSSFNREDWVRHFIALTGELTIPENITITITSKEVNDDLASRYDSLRGIPMASSHVAAAILPVNGNLHLAINWDIFRNIPDSHARELISHELTHVEQLETGRLIVDQEGSTYWTVEGEEVYLPLHIDHKNKANIDDGDEFLLYEIVNKPWEQEAYLLNNSRVIKEKFKGKQIELIIASLVPSLKHLAKNLL